MKWIVLASVLAFGAPAIAQDQTTGTGSPATQSEATPPAQDQTAPTSTTMPDQMGTQTGTTTDQTGQTGTTTDQSMSTTTGAGTATADPAGSMTQPGMAGTGTTPGGGNVVFQPAQAAPAPAAQTSYPLCSRTVRDQCRQRGG